MTQKTIKFFIDEIYAKPPEKKYPTNKINVYQSDGTWSLDILGLKDYGPKNIRGYRYALVVSNSFSNFIWTVPLHKNAQTIKKSFEKTIISSKRKPRLFETDRGEEFHNNKFQNFIKSNNIKFYSRSSSLVAISAEKF